MLKTKFGAALSVSLEISSAQDSTSQIQNWFPHTVLLYRFFFLLLHSLTVALSFLSTSIAAMFGVYISFLFVL